MYVISLWHWSIQLSLTTTSKLASYQPCPFHNQPSLWLSIATRSSSTTQWYAAHSSYFYSLDRHYDNDIYARWWFWCRVVWQWPGWRFWYALYFHVSDTCMEQFESGASCRTYQEPVTICACTSKYIRSCDWSQLPSMEVSGILFMPSCCQWSDWLVSPAMGGSCGCIMEELRNLTR